MGAGGSLLQFSLTDVQLILKLLSGFVVLSPLLLVVYKFAGIEPRSAASLDHVIHLRLVGNASVDRVAVLVSHVKLLNSSGDQDALDTLFLSVGEVGLQMVFAVSCNNLNPSLVGDDGIFFLAVGDETGLSLKIGGLSPSENALFSLVDLVLGQNSVFTGVGPGLVRDSLNLELVHLGVILIDQSRHLSLKFVELACLEHDENVTEHAGIVVSIADKDLGVGAARVDIIGKVFSQIVVTLFLGDSLELVTGSCNFLLLLAQDIFLVFHFLVDLSNQLGQRSLLVIPGILPSKALNVVTVRHLIVAVHKGKLLEGDATSLKGDLLKLLAGVLKSQVNLLGLLVQDHKLVNGTHFELLFLNLFKLVDFSAIATSLESSAAFDGVFNVLLVLAFNVGGDDVEHTLNNYY